MQGHLLVAHLPEDVHALARRLLESSPELVLRQPFFEALAQRLFCPEEAVRRHQPLDPLVRTEVVVVREVVP